MTLKNQHRQEVENEKAQNSLLNSLKSYFESDSPSAEPVTEKEASAVNDSELFWEPSSEALPLGDYSLAPKVGTTPETPPQV
jgi:hypothetical protein